MRIGPLMTEDRAAMSRMPGTMGLVEPTMSRTRDHGERGSSRARLVAAADRERRRVARDLHDGAQQRLVHTVIALKLAEAELRDHDGRAARLVSEALRQAEAATAELRELVHGVMPRVLTRGGLPAGARSLAARMIVPTEVDVSTGRLPEPIEASAYFVIAEALTNVAKHARAQRATVIARVADGMLHVEVHDDGVGGALIAGNGLVGLQDRVTALNGSFSVVSPPGSGTVVRAAIPVPG
jgi:signal transduction histidine kinase